MSEWISVKDKVPFVSQDLPHLEKTVECLCIYKYHDKYCYDVAHYYDYGDHRKGWQSTDWHLETETPIYWMPIPEPPKDCE